MAGGTYELPEEYGFVGSHGSTSSFKSVDSRSHAGSREGSGSEDSAGRDGFLNMKSMHHELPLPPAPRGNFGDPGPLARPSMRSSHTRNTSWSSTTPQAQPHGLYMHANNTVGNVMSPSVNHSVNGSGGTDAGPPPPHRGRPIFSSSSGTANSSRASSRSSSISSIHVDRKGRMDRIYGGVRQTSGSSSAVAPGYSPGRSTPGGATGTTPSQGPPAPLPPLPNWPASTPLPYMQPSYGQPPYLHSQIHSHSQIHPHSQIHSQLYTQAHHSQSHTQLSQLHTQGQVPPPHGPTRTESSLSLNDQYPRRRPPPLVTNPLGANYANSMPRPSQSVYVDSPNPMHIFETPGLLAQSAPTSPCDANVSTSSRKRWPLGGTFTSASSGAEDQFDTGNLTGNSTASTSPSNAGSNASSQHTSPHKNQLKSSKSSRNISRSDSPSLMSRIGNRISSGFSSRMGSRMGSQTGSRMSSRVASRLSGKDSSMSMHASSGLNGATTSIAELKPAIMDLVLEDDDWPEFTPRRAPASAVVDQVQALASSTAPIADIDTSAKFTPKPSTSLPLTAPDAEEARGFAPRGLFFYTVHAGTTDEEGNYHHVEGEQIGFRYSVVGTLGKGSFGTVLKCRDHKSGRMVAVKVTARRPELHSQVKIEATLLRSLLIDHQGQPESNHFLRYIEHFKFRGHMCIATELLGPNLYEILKRNHYEGLDELTVRYITRQLCEGLEFLNSKKIIHCDIKPENILLSDLEKCQVKIVDFGSSCYEGRRLYTYIQSRFYRAPEILLGMPYGPPIDMWSLGTIVPELLLGRPLFPSADEPDQVALISQVLGSPDHIVMWRSTRSGIFFDPTGMPIKLQNSKGVMRQPPGSTPLRAILHRFSDDAIDFCEQTLRWAPDARLRADKAVYHPFVLGH